MTDGEGQGLRPGAGAPFIESQTHFSGDLGVGLGGVLKAVHLLLSSPGHPSLNTPYHGIKAPLRMQTTRLVDNSTSTLV